MSRSYRPYAKPVTATPHMKPVSFRLSAPFTKCPVCGGTTGMDDANYPDGTAIFMFCYSCDTRWNLQGAVIKVGKVTRLPLLHNPEE